MSLPWPFVDWAVNLIAPDQRGVYGLFRDQECGRIWVYIGQGNIRERLQAHLRGDNFLIAAWSPTHFVTAVVPFPELEEKRLIEGLRPVANLQVG